MIFSQKVSAILFLQRRGFVLYIGGRGQGEPFEFSEKSVFKEEIVDKGVLKEEIKKFLEEKKLHATHAIIVLSQQVLFGKQITSADPTQQQNGIKDFLDEIPFEHISRKIFRIDNKLNIIATNKDLYEKIAKSLTEFGWTIDAVVPVVLFGKIGINNLLSGEDIIYIYKRPDLVRVGNFLEVDNNTYYTGSLVSNSRASSKEKRTFGKKAIIVGIATFLLIIAAILLIFMSGVLKL